MMFVVVLFIVLFGVSCSRKQEPENVLVKHLDTTVKSNTIASSSTKKQASNKRHSLADDVDIPDTFIVVQPSIDALFVHAFEREVQEKEWEATIIGVVLISPDWEEDIDPNTQEILGRIRTAAVFSKGEEGLCYVFERYTIFQEYKNGKFVGKPREYAHTESKEIECKKYQHFFFKPGTKPEFDERNE